MASKVTTVTLKEDTVAKIEVLKRQERKSMAWIINEAVKAYYELKTSLTANN